MHRIIIASVLAASTLWFTAPASAQPQPALPAAQQTLNAGSIRIDRFSDAGKQAVVFIPGLTCGPWEFAREIKAFSQSYSVYAITLPGFDGQPATAGPLFDTAGADIWKAFAAAHITQPILVGHSLGGTMSLLLATQQPQQLRAVVTIDGLPVFPGAENKTEDQRKAAGAQMQTMMAMAKTPAQFEFAERTYSLPYLVTAPADAEAIAKLAARSDPATSGRWAAEDYALDLRPALPKATVPILEVAPYDPTLERAMLASPEAAQRYYAGLLAGAPQASVQVIAGSRHFAMYDQPAALDAILTAFLETNRARKGL